MIYLFIKSEVAKEIDCMFLWWFTFICDILIPITMVVLGRIMRKRPPKNINGIVGYRTSRSMKNMDTWQFAHDFCGRLWWKIGWIILFPAILISIPFYSASENALGALCGILCTIQCAIMIATVFLTERALKRTFTDEGIRR